MIQLSFIDAADQQFGTIINNQRVTFRFRWNLTSNSWAFDLSIDDLPIITGRRVVLGCNLIAAFNLNLGQLWAIAIKEGAYPGRSELPSGDVRLYHFMDSELEAYEAG